MFRMLASLIPMFSLLLFAFIALILNSVHQQQGETDLSSLSEPESIITQASI